MAFVSEKCATTDERWGAVWRGVFPTAGVTPPNCAKAFAAPILTSGFRSCSEGLITKTAVLVAPPFSSPGR
jgi:hypothetical protein